MAPRIPATESSPLIMRGLAQTGGATSSAPTAPPRRRPPKRTTTPPTGRLPPRRRRLGGRRPVGGVVVLFGGRRRGGAVGADDVAPPVCARPLIISGEDSVAGILGAIGLLPLGPRRRSRPRRGVVGLPRARRRQRRLLLGQEGSRVVAGAPQRRPRRQAVVDRVGDVADEVLDARDGVLEALAREVIVVLGTRLAAGFRARACARGRSSPRLHAALEAALF